MTENWMDELWLYAGLRDSGDTAVWIPVLRYHPSGDLSKSAPFEFHKMTFKAKGAKANAVGAFYKVSVDRNDEGFQYVRLGGMTFVGSGIIHDVEMPLWIDNDSTWKDNVQRFAALDQVARGAIMEKRAENKVDRITGESVMDLTVSDLQQLARQMNRSEQRILQAKINQWVGL